MTVSDDGQFLYVALAGAGAVRRINLNTQIADQQFWVGNQVSKNDVIPTSEGPYLARDLITLAGQSNSLAIVRHFANITGAHGVALYQDGQKLPVDSGSIDIWGTFRLTRSASPGVLYGISDTGDFLKFGVDQNGISLVRVTRYFDLINAGNGNDIFFGGGFVFTKNNLKIDPEIPQIVGRFPVPSPQAVEALVPDPQTDRLYVLATNSCGAGCTYTVNIYAYDLTTLTLIDSIAVPGVSGLIKKLVRWGSNGLAFNTSEKTYVLRTSLVPSGDPVDLPVASQPVRSDPPLLQGTIHQIALPNDDLIYDSQRQRIYASIPGFAGSNGNSILPINPVTSELGTPISIGIDPGKLAISRNKQFLYTSLIGEEKVRRLNLETQQIDDEFRISNGQGPTFAFDIAVFPDDPTSVVVGTSASLFLGGNAKNMLVYKNGFLFSPRGDNGFTVIETSDEPSVFYGVDQQSLGGTLYTKWKFGEPSLFLDNISPQIVVHDLVGGFATDTQWEGGLLFDGNGRVGDPRTLKRLGTFDLAGSLSRSILVPDTQAGRAYFLSGLQSTSGSTWTLRAFDLETFLPAGKIDIPGVIGPAGSLIRWGADGIAFGTGGNQVFLIQSPAFAVTASPTPTPAPTPSFIQFASSQQVANEGDGNIKVTVTRSGDTSETVTLDYASHDAASIQKCDEYTGAASSRCDYTTTLGTLRFGTGETSKIVTVPIVDDALAEGIEVFHLTLSDLHGGQFTGPTTATLTINDNDSVSGEGNPIDDAPFFVRQHYLDFLNREPDASGFAFWTNEITQCAADVQCREIKRINVSAAFFLSIEFQETGYFVYRMHKEAFGNLPGAPVPITFNEFLRETQQVSEGVRVGVGNWQSQLEINKIKYVLAFVQRPDFMAAFPHATTAQEFVTRLDANAGGVMAPTDKSNAIAMLNAVPYDIKTRMVVLRAICDTQAFKDKEVNNAFVLMQYFGYLRRNPNDSPNSDFSGFNFWLEKLNQFNGNFINAEMVKAFIQSTEYQKRFGP
jgi:hypothetical protein